MSENNRIRYFDLTPGQLLIMYGERRLAKGSQNVGSRIDITSDIDEDLLRQAIVIATYRVPCTRIRIHKKNKNEFVQYLSDEMPSAPEYIDARSWSKEQLSQQLVKWNGTPFSDDLTDVQLYRIKLLRTAEGYTVFISTHHSIMDAYGLMTFITYIDQLYCALKSASPLPEQMPSPIAMIEKENQYYGSKRYEADKAWFGQMFSNGLDFKPYTPGSGMSLRAKLANPVTAKGGMINLIIPKETVELINSAADKFNVSPGVLYMLSIRTILAKSGNNDDVVFNAIMSRRSTLLQKRSGCSIANALPFRSCIGSELSFENAVAKFSTVLHDLYKHSSFPCEEAFGLLANSGNVTAADPVSVTYQPYFNMNGTEMDFTVQRVFTGKSMSRFYVSIMPYDGTGSMYGNYEFFYDVFTSDDIENFHTTMLRFLEAGIASPEKTIGQLINECI